MIKPCSKAKVTYHFYKTTVINNYLLDYEIDINKTKLKCKNTEIPFGGNMNVENRLNRGNPPLEVVFHNNWEYILKNVPATEKINSYEGEVVFANQKNVTNYELCMEQK